MPNLLKTEAIVLRRRSLLNKDSLVTFFTKESGKVTVVAKGVKKTTSRRAPHLQTGNLLEIVCNVRNERKYLGQTSLISAFSEIKKDKRKMNYLYLLLFILDRLLPEEQEEAAVYLSTKKYFIELSKSTSFMDATCAHLLFPILSQLGYVKEEISLPDIISQVEEVINEKVPTSVL